MTQSIGLIRSKKVLWIQNEKTSTVSESLFECSVPGFTHAFVLFSELELHLNVGQHIQATSESFYDKLRKKLRRKICFSWCSVSNKVLRNFNLSHVHISANAFIYHRQRYTSDHGMDNQQDYEFHSISEKGQGLSDSDIFNWGKDWL